MSCLKEDDWNHSYVNKDHRQERETEGEGEGGGERERYEWLYIPRPQHRVNGVEKN